MLRTIIILSFTIVCSQLVVAVEPAFTPEQLKYFNDKVAPLLKEQCFKCHGDKPEKLSGELNLKFRATALKGGESGPAVVPGKAAESLLVLAINHAKEGYAMPPDGKMDKDKIEILTKWVNDGFAYPPDMIGKIEEHKKPKITPEQRAYWAYQPVKRSVVPDGAKHPIDAFLNAKLKAKNLQPTTMADKLTLVRRAYYDLIGLPPTPVEIDDFLNDKSADAWEKLIDKLLASPAYGEKWGRHWLDIVRYAETNGYERDGPKPNAWRYRDYVIKSFNNDKPYDRFVREQLAGDELPRTDGAEELIATGFYRLGVWDDEPADPLQARMDGYDDMVTIIGQAFLGMTFNCARCHDHKGDPILQADYYKMVAFIRDIPHFSDTRNAVSKNSQTDITPMSKRQLYEKELGERQKKIEEILAKMKPIEDAAIKKMPPKDQLAVDDGKRDQIVKKVPMYLTGDEKTIYNRMVRDVEDLRRKPVPAQEFALCVNQCNPNPPTTYINIRGNAHANGAAVKPAFPEVLSLPEPMIPSFNGPSSGRRTVLANWITDKANPMTARVMVNRLWLHHFGRGIVPTPNDFGKLGEQPTHPELLDWLASEFVNPSDPKAAAWTIKRMHKLMMTSDAYQRSSKANEASLKADPANSTYWRFNMRRLNAEEVRDSILAVSGSLNTDMYGPSVYPKIPREVLAGQSVPGSGWHHDPNQPALSNRRSIYAHVKRSLQVPILIAHDQADPDNSCPVRYTTTVPTQALGMLNGEFTNGEAKKLATRLTKDAKDLPSQIALGIRLTTGRVAGKEEIEKDIKFIEEMKAKHKLTDEQAMSQWALLQLNTNEFIYLD